MVSFILAALIEVICLGHLSSWPIAMLWPSGVIVEKSLVPTVCLRRSLAFLTQVRLADRPCAYPQESMRWRQRDSSAPPPLSCPGNLRPVSPGRTRYHRQDQDLRTAFCLAP